MKKQELIIFPYNGNGIEALDCIGEEFEFIGFADDTIGKQGKHEHYQVFPRSIIDQYPEANVLAVPGSPSSFRIRNEIIASLNIPDSRFATVIHPSAQIANRRNIGFNTLIMAGVVVTSNGKVGNHVCMLPNSVLHHDSMVGDYTLVGSNIVIAGGTKVGRNCYIGSGSNIINGIEIGDYTLVGMGSNVIRNVPANSIIAGNPAKEVKKK